jgi:formate/nitrite transporter FocA (FNT family)
MAGVSAQTRAGSQHDRFEEQRPGDPAEDPAAEEKDAALDRIVLLGGPRLRRSWYDLLATAVVAGVEIGFGVLALLTVEHVTGSRLLGSVAFSIGFVALLLGHSELFTEGFLVPVTTVAAGVASWWQLVRLWIGTLVGNLVGGWVVAWLIVTGLPELRETTIASGTEYAASSLTSRTFALAVLAGAAITLLTRMQNGTENDVAKMLACVAIAFVIVGGGLFHSILDSILVFGALHAGAPAIGYGNWLWWFAWTVVGNMVGGLGLVTLLRLVRSQGRLQQWRRDGAAGEDSAETSAEDSAGDSAGVS